MKHLLAALYPEKKSQQARDKPELGWRPGHGWHETGSGKMPTFMPMNRLG
jgi:hypothetical protein